MKYLVKYLSFLAFLLVQTLVWGQQDSTVIKTFVKPGNQYRIKINQQLQLPTNTFKVPHGRHHISIWAPGYHVFDTTVVVSRDQLRLVKVLHPTQELIDYQLEKDVYDMYKKRTIMSGCVTGIFGALAIFNYNRISDLNLEQIKQENGVKYDVIGYNQSGLDEADKSLKNARIIQYSLYAAMTASVGYAVLNYVKMKKYGKPVLEDKSGFIVEDLGMTVLPNNKTGVYARFRF